MREKLTDFLTDSYKTSNNFLFFDGEDDFYDMDIDYSLKLETENEMNFIIRTIIFDKLFNRIISIVLSKKILEISLLLCDHKNYVFINDEKIKQILSIPGKFNVTDYQKK